MSKLNLALNYREWKAVKHALELRVKRANISNKDYEQEKIIVEKINDIFERLEKTMSCGCPR